MNFEQRAFEPMGPTIIIAGATTAPDGELLAATAVASVQARFYNSGAVVAWLAFGTSAAAAKAAAVIPTAGTPRQVIPLLAGSIIEMTVAPGMFWSVITGSSTANVYATPGRGL